MLKKLFCITSVIFIFILFSAYSYAEDSGSSGKRYFNLRLSGGMGVFYYPQTVEDGGYRINGVGYNLTWYGSQFHISGETLYYITPRLSFGFGGSYFIAPNPTAMDETNSVSIDAKDDGKGGFGGISGSFMVNNWSRINVLAGYGGTGVKDNYGGYGPAVSAGWSMLHGSGDFIGGIGARLLLMRLYSPADADTRAESGLYMAVMIEASIDIAPKF